MSRFRLIALGLGSAALVLSAAGCAGGVSAGNGGGGAATTAAASTKIVIGSPGLGQTLHTPFTASGTVPASVTGSIFVDTLDDSGKTVCLREVPASAVSGGKWTAQLSGPIPPKDALITVRAYTEDSTGKAQNIAKVDIDVSSFSTPTITVSSPACHSTISGGTIAVTGTAKDVSGQAVVELRDATGKALAKSNIAVTKGAAYTPWSASVAVPASLPAGLYDLVAYQTGSDGTSVQQEYYVQLVKG